MYSYLTLSSRTKEIYIFINKLIREAAASLEVYWSAKKPIF